MPYGDEGAVHPSEMGLQAQLPGQSRHAATTIELNLRRASPSSSRERDQSRGDGGAVDRVGVHHDAQDIRKSRYEKKENTPRTRSNRA